MSGDEHVLRWRAGRFVSPRGHGDPIHFMAQKDYAIDDGADFAELLTARALRAAREGAPDPAAADAGFASWAKGLERLAVARAVDALAGDGAAEIVDVGGGVAVQYEFLKYLRESRGAEPVDYAVVGDEDHGRKVTVLHDAENGVARYEAGEWPAHLSADAVLVLNQSEAVRHRRGPVPDVGAALRHPGPTCLVVRALDTPAAETRMTVKGRVVTLPSLRELRAACALTGGAWLERWDPDHDTGFFLPEPDGAPAGLWIAVRGVPSLRGFTPPPVG